MDRLRTLARALSLISLCLWPRIAHADWPASPLVNLPVCTAAGSQGVYSLIGDELGGMIAFWTDSRSGDYDIYAGRVNAAGDVLWTFNGAPIAVTNGNQELPQAIPDGAGGAIVVWQDSRDGTYDIYAQRIDATGAALWASGGVPSCTAPGHQFYPEIVPDGAGGAVIVWGDERVSGYNNFYAQRIGADGAPQWPADGVALSIGLVESQRPWVATDESSGVIVTWHAIDSPGIHPRAQRVDGSGIPRWGTNGVELANISKQTDPRPVRDGLGGAIIAWADYRDGTGLTATTYAQHLNAAGVPQWTANGIALAAPSGDQEYQAVVPDGAGGAVVVWADYSSTAIRAQRVSASGALQWSPAGASVCSATGNRETLHIESDGAGGVLVPWSDYRDGGGDVYVQHLDHAGLPAWMTDGVAVCKAPYIQVNPEIVPDGSGGALVAWSDYRSRENFHVYAQNVGADGTLGGTTVGVAGSAPLATLAVRCAGTNPHFGALTVDCSLPASGTALIGLFDVSGRCLESRTLEATGGGTRRVTFAAAPGARASGVYFVRLVQGERRAATRLVLVR